MSDVAPYVSLTGMSKSFVGVKVLKDVSFDVRPARCTRCSARTAPASRR